MSVPPSSTPRGLRRAGATTALAVTAALALPAVAPAASSKSGSSSSSKSASSKSAAAKRAAAKRAQARRDAVAAETQLKRLRRAGTISASDASSWAALLRNAKFRAKRLSGTPAKELKAVVENTERIAVRKKLTADLAPSVFLTLQVNRDWWRSTPAPGAGARPPIAGSPLTWQYYPGEGIQIQWLATFGNANALATTKTPAKLEQLRAIEDEALRLASRRSGGPSWQYLFDFGGGAPPWASGMAQATAMQSLVRTSVKLGDPKYVATALQAVQLLRHRAPGGVLYKRPTGDHLLLYSFSKGQVLNAFTQTVSALREVAATTGDPKVTSSYVRAERELRVELPRFDTGRWARYQLGGANMTLSYMTLTRDLLKGLCSSLTKDAQAVAAGGTAPGGTPPPAAPYCDAATTYTGYLEEGPPSSRATSRSAGDARVPRAVPAPDPDPSARVGAAATARP